MAPMLVPVRRAALLCFAAKPEDFTAATHRVYRTSTYPSRVEIPVVR
jgi:hypothetical protein